MREWGAHDAPAVVFWPGLNPSAPWQLDEAGPVWAEEYGFRVLAVSPPGWESPPLPRRDYRPTVLARRIVDFLDHAGLGRAAFVGFSWGASIGCHLAVRSPERLTALVLLDAGYTDFQDDPRFERRDPDEMVELVSAQRRFESWNAYLDAMRARTTAWRPALERRVRAAVDEEPDGAVVVRVPPEVVVAAADGVVDERPSRTLADLGRASLQILLVVASRTVEQAWARAALERFRAAVAHADVREIDSGHDVLAGARDETIRVVGDWLRSVTILRA